MCIRQIFFISKKGAVLSPGLKVPKKKESNQKLIRIFLGRDQQLLSQLKCLFKSRGEKGRAYPLVNEHNNGKAPFLILLMKEIPTNHLGCIKKTS